MKYAEKLEKLGFMGFEPSLTDKTYYFSKHIEKGKHSCQLWVELKRSIPIVTYKYDYKVVVPEGSVIDAVTDFLEKLGYDVYDIAEQI